MKLEISGTKQWGKAEPEAPDDELAVAKQVLADTLDAVDEGVVLWDTEDRLVICNEGYRKLFGENCTMVKPGARYKDLMRLQLEGGALRIGQGQRREWLENRLSDHRNPKGAIDEEYSDGRWVRVTEYKTPAGYTVGVYTEVSQIKRRETALKMFADSNRRVAAAVDASASAILITDPHRPGNPTVFANPAFATMTGWPVEEALGRDRSFLNGPDTDMAEVARFEQDMRAGHPTSAELRLKDRSGRTFWVDVNASPIRDNDGRAANWVIVQTDITARKEAPHRAPRPQDPHLAGHRAGDLADLLRVVGNKLEAALQVGGPMDAESRRLVESALEAARGTVETTRPARAPEGWPEQASAMNQLDTQLFGCK